jgi:putative endonuclease
LRKQAMLVFVEVKRARSFAVAAERVTQRQLARIIATASEFVATEPAGQDSEMRFDAALVDEIGRIEIRENILAW